MPPRHYSHQDLRDRSFKYQDLARADFSYSDLRGCDFTGATLTRANFQGCRTGQSRRWFPRRITIAGAGAFAFTIAGAGAGAFAGAFAFAFAFAGAFAFAFAFAVAFAVAVAVALAFAAIEEFSKGRPIEGITYSISSLILFGFAIYSFLELVKTIRNATGTSFKKTQLSHADFSNATLKNTDFSDTNTALAIWTNASFSRCILPEELAVDQALELAFSRDGHRQNYSHLTLKNLNLQAVDLTRATLFHTNLNGSNLRKVQLNDANLAHAQALGTDFSEADLTGACIQNWGINADTKFTNVRCNYIYLESDQQHRKPASGIFQPGDFEKLVHQFTKTLDFLFRNGIDPQAFDFALQNLLTDYEHAGLSMHSVIDVGDGDRLTRFNVANPDADKGAMHAQLVQDYESMHKQLETERAEKYGLREQVAEMQGQLTVYREQSVFLQGFVYHQTDRFSRPSFNAPNSHFLGDPMADKSNKVEIQKARDVSGIAAGKENSAIAGKNITGATVGDVSGTLTVTMGQLAETKDPQAVKLAALLQQVKTAVEKPDSGLSEGDRQKALKHLETLGKLAQDKQNPELLEKAGDALDALPTIMKRSDNLATFVEKYFPTFTAGVKAIFAVWGVPL